MRFIPIPPPDRLIPRRYPPTRGGGGSTGSPLLDIAGFGAMLFGPITVGMIAGSYSTAVGWIAGIVTFAVFLALAESEIGMGVMTMVFYTPMAYMFGEGDSPGGGRVLASIAFVITALLTFFAWRRSR